MKTVTLAQVKETFDEVFCSGCCGNCAECEIEINQEKMINILHNISIINEIDENLKGGGSDKYT